jgi:hypothetical protein
MTVICILYIFHHLDTSGAIIYGCTVSVFVYLQYVHNDKKQQLIFVSFLNTSLLFLSFSHFIIKQLHIFFANHFFTSLFLPTLPDVIITTLVNTQNVSVTKIVDSSSIQRAETKYGLRIQFLALVFMIHEVWLNA